MNNIFWLYVVLTTEVWKDIPWFETYQASTFWNVRSKSQMRNLKWKIDKDWYRIITLSLWKNWFNKSFRCHRLICKTFYWESDLQVNHILWIKDFNYLWNLEYCTCWENILHSYIAWIRKKKYIFERNLRWQFV